MELEQDAESVRQVAIRLNNYLNDKTHANLKKNFSNLRYLIESPLFSQLFRIRRSLDQLGVLSKSYDLDSNDFDIHSQSGELEICRDAIKDVNSKQKTNDRNELQSASLVDGRNPIEASTQVLNNGMKKFEESFNNKQVEKITLHRGTASTIGLSLNRRQQEGDNQNVIFISSIQPGGIVDKDGRLCPGDQILAINEKSLGPQMSDEEIVELLQKCNDAVELIVVKSSRRDTETGQKESSPVKSQIEKEGENEEEDDDDDDDLVELIPVHLVNDGSGLGFGIVKRPLSGVMIRTVLAGSIAEKDGRLRTDDHILLIEDQLVKDLTTNEVASILKQSGVDVRLTLGRPYRGSVGDEGSKVVVPAARLAEVLNSMCTRDLGQPHVDDAGNYYEVELTKDSAGLGLTINGCHAPDGSTQSIVSDISKNGVADRNGRISVGDQIVEVNGISLRNSSNVRAAGILKNTGSLVRLKMLRRMIPDEGEVGSSSDGSDVFSPQSTDQRSSTRDQTSVNLEKKDSSSSDENNDKIAELKNFWKEIIGHEYDIVVAKVVKSDKNGSLGISLDSRIKKLNSEEEEVEDPDAEGDVEHFHFLHSISPVGPVAKEGSLRPGDRLVQVDSHSTINMPHNEVAALIRGLGTHICMVCARIPSKSNQSKFKPSIVANVAPSQHLPQNGRSHPPGIQSYHESQAQSYEYLNNSANCRPIAIQETRRPHHGVENDFAVADNIQNQNVPKNNLSTTAQKCSSTPSDVVKTTVESRPRREWTATEMSTADGSLNDSMSSQAIANLFAAGWYATPYYVDMLKEEQGLGFSIIDYENPEHQADTAILIRSIVPGSPADAHGKLQPGDKLVSINDVCIPQSDLESSVDIIRNVPRGHVRICVMKPVQPLEATPMKTSSFELDAPLLSPPIKFSSKYLLPTDLHHDTPGSTPTTDDPNLPHNYKSLVQPVVPDNFSSTAKFATDRQIGDEDHRDNLDFSVINSKENFPAVENGDARQGKDVVTFKKQAEVNVERIFQQHFPRPAPATQVTGAITEARLVDVRREGDKGLGISIVGGSTFINKSKGIFIKSVFPSGPAGKPGKLRSGDRILEVNGINCREATHEQVVEVIKNASNPIWFLVQNAADESSSRENGSLQDVSRPIEREDPEQKYGHLKGDLHSIEIDLGFPRTNLGLILAGNKSLDQMSTFVAAVQPGSAACMDGRIVPGDELLEINNQILHERSHLNSSYLIKSLDSQTVQILLLRNPENLAKMALNPRSPLPSPKLMNIPRRSVAAMESNKNNSPNDSCLNVDVLKKAKSSEFLPLVDSSAKTTLTSPTEQLSKAKFESSSNHSGTAIKMAAAQNGNEIPDSRTHANRGDLINVEVERENGGLGISIIGGKDTLLGSIVISDIYATGAANRDGRLKVGDVLLKVNGTSLENVTREAASKLLKQGPSKALLTIKRAEDELFLSEENFETFTVDLNKKSGQSLGLTIIGKHQDSSIYVCELMKGGIAEADGKLKPGDEILSINKKTFKGQEAAAELLKSATGMVRLAIRRIKSKTSTKLAGIPAKLQKQRTLNADIFSICLSRFDRGLMMLVLEKDDNDVDERPKMFIKEVKGNDPISKRFQANDRIIGINGTSTDDLSVDGAMETIHSSSGGVIFEILRGSLSVVASPLESKINPTASIDRASEPNVREDERIKIVTLHKEPPGYGFSIVGGIGSSQGDLPIFVKNVFDGGVAARDGRLRRGDKLLAVNGESLDGMSHNEAVSVLKDCQGTVVLTIIE